MTTQNSLRIALFTYASKPRGSVVHTVELAEALHSLGYEACIYALDKDGTGLYRPPLCSHKLVPTQPVSGGIDALIQQRIQEFVDYLHHSALTYDCYHVQDCISANALSILRTEKQIPHFVRTVHHIEDYNSLYLQECQDKSIRHPDLCLCVSQTWQAALWEQYQINAPKVINGVNSKRFSPVKSGEDKLKHKLEVQGSPLYLTAGGIEPRRNSIALLQAFAEVLIHYPQAQLVIAGGATLFDYQAYRDEFFALAETINITVGKSLLLPGVIPDAELPTLYRLADAFVFPSVKEGWGLVVLEALASGIPVITSNQPPFTEFLSRQEALLVDPESVTAIAQAMQTVLQPDTSHRLRQQGKAISDRYT